MPDYTGRYFSNRDMNLLNSINQEWSEEIIQVVVQIYKICPQQTNTNIYGETDQSTGKFYFSPVVLTTKIVKDKNATTNNQFGTDRNQPSMFAFREVDLQELNFFPQTGDLIAYNERFYEVDNVEQERFLGLQPDKSWAITTTCHYTRFSKLNIIPRNT